MVWSSGASRTLVGIAGCCAPAKPTAVTIADTRTINRTRVEKVMELICVVTSQKRLTVVSHNSAHRLQETENAGGRPLARAASFGPPFARAVALALASGSHAGEVVVAVPDGVILEHELARERRVGVERDRGGPIELLVAERANGSRGCRAVPPEQVERRLLRDARRTPWRARHSSRGRRPSSRPSIGLPAGKRLRQLDLQRVDAGDVMHDDADRAAVSGDAGLPLGVGERAREGGERAGSLLRGDRRGRSHALIVGASWTAGVTAERAIRQLS